MDEARPPPFNRLGLFGQGYPQVFNALAEPPNKLAAATQYPQVFNALAHPPSLEARKLILWARLRPHPRFPGFYVDHEGWLVRWPEYGLLSNYGWEIDHIIRKADGGSDDLSNLRVRHWWPNRSAGNHSSNSLARFR